MYTPRLNFVTWLKYLVPVTLVLLVLPAPSVTMPPVCCFPDMYQSHYFGMKGEVDVSETHYGEGYGFFNASVQTAYDAVNERTYRHWDMWMWLSFIPTLHHVNGTDIYDYKNNIQYNVYSDGTCSGSEIFHQMYRECIPGNATLMSVGHIGNDVQVKTYFFRDFIYTDPYEITVTVAHSAENTSECVPIRLSNSQAYIYHEDHDVDITVADVVDVIHGIHDTSIFNPPANCNNYTTENDEPELSAAGMFALPFQGIRRSHKLKNMIRTLLEKESHPKPLINKPLI